MNTVWIWIIGGVLAYLFGSIPFGFVIAKCKGVDIRTVGSGNIGATNVYRSVGKSWGLLTFLLDFLKGVAGTTLIPWLCLKLGDAGNPQYLKLFCGVMTVLGHSWTCFLHFKGGKGVATSAGMLVGIVPLAFGIAFGTWLLVLLTLRYMSVASCSGAAALAVTVWVLEYPKNHDLVLPIVLTVLAALVIWRHRSNIKRLIAGTEPHFTFGKGK